MRHVFRATKLGWDSKQEGVWFDSDDYTEDEAKSEFKPYSGTTQDGYSYTGYEYDGQKYHDVTYLGDYPDDKMPKDNLDYIDSLVNRLDRGKKDGRKI